MAKNVLGLDKCFYHVEQPALVRVRWKGCKLIVARVLRDGSPANAKPCLVCTELARIHGGWFDRKRQVLNLTFKN